MEHQVVQYCVLHDHICWTPSYEREDIKNCSFKAIRLGDLVSYIRHRTANEITMHIGNMFTPNINKSMFKTKL